MIKFYFFACVLGTVLPYSALIGWGLEHGGLDIQLMITEIAASRMSTFAWLDVLISAVVLIYFIRHEGKRMGLPRLWAPIAGTCLVGVSLGLPLFLMMREIQMKAGR